MEPVVKAEGVGFAYTDEKVLTGVSFEVVPGEFLSVIGPNGSGKTTLLRLLYRHLSPLEGTIYVNNMPIENISRRNLSQKIAVVSQVPQFHFGLSALELVLMGRSPHMGLLAFEGKQDFAIASEAMVLTDVSDFRDRSIFSLSGGELQRVVIARALAQEPEAMLLDEPTSYLDIKHQIGICQLLRTMNEEKGITIVSVFHDINLASSFSDRVMIMKGGKMQGLGPPEDMITKEALESVYGCQVFVDENPLTGKPRVTLVAE